MTRLLVPVATPDLSALAKTLKRFLDERHAAQKPPPTHVELLNLLARAAGLRNFATLKAVALAAPAGSSSVAPSMLAGHQEAVNVSTLTPTARKALLQFDEARRLIRLPNKLSVQQMAMWALWTQLNRQEMTRVIVDRYRPARPTARLTDDLESLKFQEVNDEANNSYRNIGSPLGRCIVLCLCALHVESRCQRPQ